MFVLPRTFIALKILHHLATCSGGVAKNAAIATAILVPEPYTGKIARELLRAGFIKSVRGFHGGYTLALPASAIHVGDVAEFIEDRRKWRTPDEAEITSALKLVMEQARRKFFNVLNGRSIADLCAHPGHFDDTKKAGAYTSTEPYLCLQEKTLTKPKGKAVSAL